jgi:ankyrin repeat protein
VFASRHWVTISRAGHRHAKALHQAAVNNDIAMLELLIERGANPQTRDTLWKGTPLGWAVHNGSVEAEAYLRSLMEH